ncbi:tetratricopeptide repeat protein [Cellulomonas dongxiuzhuiae]|uniref:tetratricopeptide repeat protein n=1 Tax=Cellulomonas dongxiuzhuiae TaxID=2819979 RepID=UPI001AAE4CC1|nr:tetratricopeptide repeat protein [Cellulomonas dongxiuzhuiae]MBO3088975.1 tetratricopeptide repeat-containing protein [Cellulomonas dongxiuzhuiae]
MEHLLRLGNLYHEAGDYSRAAQMYERDIETGDPFGYQNLRALREECGDVSGATELYRVGASLGDPMAAQSYERLRTDR